MTETDPGGFGCQVKPVGTLQRPLSLSAAIGVIAGYCTYTVANACVGAEQWVSTEGLGGIILLAMFGIWGLGTMQRYAWSGTVLLLVLSAARDFAYQVEAMRKAPPGEITMTDDTGAMVLLALLATALLLLLLPTSRAPFRRFAGHTSTAPAGNAEASRTDGRRRRRRSSAYNRSSSSPGLAYASLICSVAGVALWSFALVLGPRFDFRAGGWAAEDSGTVVLFGLSSVVAVLLLMFGLGLGAGVLLTSRRKRLSATLGALLGFVGLVLLAFAMIAGLSAE